MCSCASRRVVVRPASGHRHRPPRPARRHAAMGVAATCRCTAPGRRAPSSATVASRPASQFGRLRRPRSVNQSCKACKHETRIAICNLVYAFLTGSFRFRLMPHASSWFLLYLRRGWLYLALAAWRPWLPPSHARTCTSHHLAPSRMHLSLVTCRMFSSASPTSTRLSPPPSSPQPHPTCSSNPSPPRASLAYL